MSNDAKWIAGAILLAALINVFAYLGLHAGSFFDLQHQYEHLKVDYQKLSYFVETGKVLTNEITFRSEVPFSDKGK